MEWHLWTFILTLQSLLRFRRAVLLGVWLSVIVSCVGRRTLLGGLLRVGGVESFFESRARLRAGIILSVSRCAVGLVRHLLCTFPSSFSLHHCKIENESSPRPVSPNLIPGSSTQSIIADHADRGGVARARGTAGRACAWAAGAAAAVRVSARA